MSDEYVARARTQTTIPFTTPFVVLAGLTVACALSLTVGASSIQAHTLVDRADYLIPGGENDSLATALSAGRWTADPYDDVLACSAANNSCRLDLGREDTPRDPWLREPDVVFVGIGGFGAAASFIGDVNGDGYEDIAIGSPNMTGDGAAGVRGGVWLFLSRGDSFRGRLGYYEADTMLVGAEDSDRFGASIARAGDLNHDGFDDFWVGAPGHREGTVSVGEVYLFFGRRWWPVEVAPDSAGLKVVGASPDGAFGSVIAGAVDLNRDGQYDLLTSTPSYRDAAGRVVGAAFAFVGLFGFDGRTINVSEAQVVFWGNPMVAPLGTSISVTTDLIDGGGNGPFVLIGASLSWSFPRVGGSVYVFQQSSWECCQRVNTWDAAGWLYAVDARDESGVSLAGGADIDGDGLNDVVVGAPAAHVSYKGDPGRVAIVYGNEPTSEPYVLGNATSAIEGKTHMARLGGLVLLCDFNGDGKGDIFSAAPGDPLAGPDAGAVYGFLGRPRNRPPQVHLEVSGDLTEGAWVTVNATIFDPDGDPVSWRWEHTGEVVRMNGTMTKVLQVIFPDEGKYGISIEVSDGELGASAGVELIVFNAPPTCKIDIQRPFVEGEIGELGIGVKDPGIRDGWTVTWSGPEGMSFNQSGARFRPQRGDEFMVVARAVDSDGGATYCQLFVDVENVAPTVTLSGPVLVREGDTAVYTASASDPGKSDELTYAWPEGFGRVEGPSMVWKPGKPGTFQLALKVSDLDGGIAQATLTIRVVSIPPAAWLFVPVTAREGDEINLTVKQEAGFAYDPLTVFWKVCGPGDAGAMTWHILRAVPGTFCVEATVMDDDGDSLLLQQTLVVTNRAPVPKVSVRPSAPYVEGMEITFEALLGSWETSAVDFEWALDGEGFSEAPSFSLIATAGHHRMSLVAKDGHGGFSRFNLTMNVENLAPYVRIDGPTTIEPGAVGIWNATAFDASGKMNPLAWDVDGVRAGAGPELAWSSHTQGPHIVRVTADDGNGGITVATLVVTVEASAPLNAGIDLRWAAVPLGAAAAFAAGLVVGAWAFGRWKERLIEPEE